jgi:hypothetical protein
MPIPSKTFSPQWSAVEFLAALGRRGIVLLAVDGAIVAYPEAQLTDSDREAIRQHRAALALMLPMAVVVA